MLPLRSVEELCPEVTLKPIDLLIKDPVRTPYLHQYGADLTIHAVPPRSRRVSCARQTSV
ncbi:hypothetical protein ABZ079_06710 [Streptomyces sp. NPDC006314]|uniref:hypothetical protein n=1 Tax=Streptomyces sp. NPDC006314 TaxID=3154475 RepID=UPI0033B74B21